MKHIRDIAPEDMGDITIEQLGSQEAKKAFDIALKILPQGCIFREDECVDSIFSQALLGIVGSLNKTDPVDAISICERCDFYIGCPHKPRR